MRQRWIQDPETGKLVKASEYQRSRADGPDILAPIEPFKSPIDGTIISCRSQLRAHNKRHGVTDFRDYGPDWFERKQRERHDRLAGRTAEARRERIEALKHAIDHHRR